MYVYSLYMYASLYISTPHGSGLSLLQDIWDRGVVLFDFGCLFIYKTVRGGSFRRWAPTSRFEHSNLSFCRCCVGPVPFICRYIYLGCSWNVLFTFY